MMWEKRITILSVVLSLAAASTLHAATVDLAWLGVAPVDDQNVSTDSGATYNSYLAGTYQFTVTNNVGASSVIPGGTVGTYCIEIGQPADSSTNTYSVLGPGLGAYVSPMTNLTRVTTFFNLFYSDSFTTDQAAAFQLDIWELTLDSTPGSLTAGSFRVQGSNTGITQANTWLTTLNASADITGVWQIYQLHNDTVQDQIFAVQGGGAGQPTPLPAALPGGLLLIGGLAAAGKLRRKPRL